MAGRKDESSPTPEEKSREGHGARRFPTWVAGEAIPRELEEAYSENRSLCNR